MAYKFKIEFEIEFSSEDDMEESFELIRDIRKNHTMNIKTVGVQEALHKTFEADGYVNDIGSYDNNAFINAFTEKFKEYNSNPLYILILSVFRSARNSDGYAFAQFKSNITFGNAKMTVEKIEEEKKDNTKYRPHVIIKGFSTTINSLRSTIEKSLKKTFSQNGAYLAHYGVRYRISYIYDRRLSDEYAYDAVLDIIPEKDLDSNNDAIAFIRTVLLSLMSTDDSWFWLSFISRLIDKLNANKNGFVSYEGFPINIDSVIYYGNPLIDNQDLSDFKTL